MSKAATLAASATEPETLKNGDAPQNGSAPEKHDEVNGGVQGEDEESDDYDEDEEADYEVCQTIFLAFPVADRRPSGGQTNCRG